MLLIRARSRSSAGQSSGFLNRRSQVRVLPGPPITQPLKRRRDLSKQVAIIGAGFSGTMAAVQLARRGIEVVLIGRHAQAGRGVAYSTEDPAHLLNIPAAKMSAWPDQPDDFVAAIAGEAPRFPATSSKRSSTASR